MAGLKRTIRILKLFDETHDARTIPEIAAALDIPVSTAYRAVREMVAEKLLESETGAHYRLGAFFVEFDRLVRVTDPLHRAGTTLLRDVVMQARMPSVGVLARLYGDTVMCVADAASADGTVRTSYERGKPRPLTRGATSKVILAQLPARRLARLMTSADAELGQGPFPKTAAEIREELAAIRRRGYSVTRGEVDKGLVGIAAPVVVKARGVIGSLSLVVEARQLDETAERRLVLLVVASASLLTEALMARPDDAERSRAAQ
jgi:DNA-binding IclR family transcriptional regulator